MMELTTSRAETGFPSRLKASYSEIVRNSLWKLSACAGKLSATSWTKKSRSFLNLRHFPGNLTIESRCWQRSKSSTLSLSCRRSFGSGVDLMPLGT